MGTRDGIPDSDIKWANYASGYARTDDSDPTCKSMYTRFKVGDTVTIHGAVVENIGEVVEVVGRNGSGQMEYVVKFPQGEHYVYELEIDLHTPRKLKVCECGAVKAYHKPTSLQHALWCDMRSKD